MLEQDRYQQYPKLYTLGMVMLMLFWTFALLGLYIVPYLLWNFKYDVPEFIISWRLLMEYDYGFSLFMAKWLTFLIFAIPALVCMIVSWIISSYIDKKIVLKKVLDERTSVPISEAPQKETISERPVAREISFATKVFLLMVVALIILFSIEWLISVPPPTG